MRWTDDARFDALIKCDVYIEGDGYLYVEDEVYSMYGDYVVRPYMIHQDGSSIRYDASGADNEYITTLKKAPFDIAKKIVVDELYYYSLDVAEEDKELIEDLANRLMKFGNKN